MRHMCIAQTYLRFLSIVGHLIKLPFKVITLNNLVEIMSIKRLNYNVYDLFRIGKKHMRK